MKRLKNEEYLRCKEEHRKRENIITQAGDELASEEEIISMKAELRTTLLTKFLSTKWGPHQLLLHQS